MRTLRSSTVTTGTPKTTDTNPGSNAKKPKKPKASRTMRSKRSRRVSAAEPTPIVTTQPIVTTIRPIDDAGATDRLDNDSNQYTSGNIEVGVQDFDWQPAGQDLGYQDFSADSFAPPKKKACYTEYDHSINSQGIVSFAEPLLEDGVPQATKDFEDATMEIFNYYATLDYGSFPDDEVIFTPNKIPITSADVDEPSTASYTANMIDVADEQPPPFQNGPVNEDHVDSIAPMTEEMREKVYDSYLSEILADQSKLEDVILHLVETGSFDRVLQTQSANDSNFNSDSNFDNDSNFNNASATNPALNNLPYNHEIFSRILPLRPLRKRTPKSRFVRQYVDVVLADDDDTTDYPITSFTFYDPSLGPTIPAYPLEVYDDDDVRYGIDERSYYGDGIIGQAVDLTCYKFAKRLFGKNMYIESTQRNEQLFREELDAIDECSREAFEELNLTSFEHKVFRLVHLCGISFIATHYRLHTRGSVKLSARAAVITVLELEMSEELRKDKVASAKFKADCQSKTSRLSEDNAFVKYPDGISEYTNDLFVRTLVRTLYLDDTKIGRMFKDMFGETIPLPMIAFVAVAIKNALEEYVKDGTLKNKNFTPRRYMEQYYKHLERLKEIVADDVLGEPFKVTISKWAKVGCAPTKKPRRSVQQIMDDIAKYDAENESSKDFTGYSGIFYY